MGLKRKVKIPATVVFCGNIATAMLLAGADELLLTQVHVGTLNVKANNGGFTTFFWQKVNVWSIENRHRCRTLPEFIRDYTLTKKLRFD